MHPEFLSADLSLLLVRNVKLFECNCKLDPFGKCKRDPSRMRHNVMSRQFGCTRVDASVCRRLMPGEAVDLLQRNG